MRESR
jgi:23S rRNA (adenine2503-C2)-methyltransferase